MRASSDLFTLPLQHFPDHSNRTRDKHSYPPRPIPPPLSPPKLFTLLRRRNRLQHPLDSTIYPLDRPPPLHHSSQSGLNSNEPLRVRAHPLAVQHFDRRCPPPRPQPAFYPPIFFISFLSPIPRRVSRNRRYLAGYRLSLFTTAVARARVSTDLFTPAVSRCLASGGGGARAASGNRRPRTGDPRSLLAGALRSH